MILPNLFIPGAGKSGTSALHEYLNQHPQIYMSKAKEPHFFSHEDRFSKGRQEYAKLFEDGKDFPVRGESSTGYMVFPKVIERIQTYIESPKFIFVLRNPIDRAYSHYWWLRVQGFETRSFRQAFLADMDEEPDPKNTASVFGSYKYYYQFGCYAKWLRRFLDAFGRDAIHIIITEQLRQKPLHTLNTCCSFLGVTPYTHVQEVIANKTVLSRRPNLYHFIMRSGIISPVSRCLKTLLPHSAWKCVLSMRELVLKEVNVSYPPLNNVEREWLASFYAGQVRDLRIMTGLNFAEWAKDFPLI